MQIFVDENVFLVKNAYKFFEKEINTLSNDEKTILLEIDIKQNAEDLIRLNKLEDGYTILNYIELLKNKFKVKYVDTNNYLDTTTISDIVNNTEEKTVMLIQKKAIINNFSILTKENDIRFYRVLGENVELWSTKDEVKNAFYVDSSDYLSIHDETKLDYVFSPRYGYLAISDNPVYEGGEGAIYRTYNNLLVKVYKEKHLTYQNYLKLKLMIDKEIYNDSIVWPLDIVYHRSHFLGYVMNEISDAEVMDDLRDISFGKYSPKDRVEIALSFLKIIDYLHNRNIVVGDLKFDNILVKNKDELYIIDTGSFQVSDYPCVVYNLEFTERVYEDNELKKTLRSVESEYFAINKILFEILMIKSPFYNSTNIELDPDKDRIFGFKLDRPNFTEKPPHHLQVWYTLDNRIRENFYYYFNDKKITYVPELINIFTVFLDKISKES